jgi:hypothetical protein
MPNGFKKCEMPHRWTISKFAILPPASHSLTSPPPFPFPSLCLCSADCDQELERLQKILEFNKARHQDSVSPSSASSPSQALAENWKGAAEKIKQELKEHEEQLAKLKEKELATAEAQESRVIDWNFLFSHAILFAVAGFICSIVLAVLPYSMFRGGF